MTFHTACSRRGQGVVGESCDDAYCIVRSQINRTVHKRENMLKEKIERMFLTKMKVCINIFIPLYLVVLLFICSGCQSKEEEKVLDIANREAIRLSNNVEKMDVKIRHTPISWNDLLSTDEYYQYLAKTADVLPSNREGLEAEKKILNGKMFWVIYYSLKHDPGNAVVGGDLWIFINEKDGSILLTKQGK
jgi:hypothetical protein